MYLTGIRKHGELLKTLRYPGMARLPWTTLLKMRRFLVNEKLTRWNGQAVINSFLPPFPSRAFGSLADGLQMLTKGRAVPVSAYVAVTNACRFRCWHCSRAFRSGSEPGLGLLKSTVVALQDLGVSIVGFTGGEPLLRDDLEEIIATVDDRSVSILFTSGDGLTSERARTLRGAGLFGMAVSLDHWDEAVHNEKRGRQDAYQVALSAIRAGVEAGIYTMIQLVATRDMLEDNSMGEYLRLASSLGVHEIRLLEPMPTGMLIGNPAGCGLCRAEREHLRKWHRVTNRDRHLPKISSFAEVEDGSMYGCGAGFQHFYVDAGGHVCPCDFVPVSFGNVRHEPLPVIWQRLQALLGRPRRECLLRECCGELSKAFAGKLPIPWTALAERHSLRNQGDVPDYYKVFGWPEKQVRTRFPRCKRASNESPAREAPDTCPAAAASCG